MVNYCFFGAKTRQKILFRKYIKKISDEYSENGYESDLSDEICILEDSSNVKEIKPFDKYDHLECKEDSDEYESDYEEDDILNNGFCTTLNRKMGCIIVEAILESDVNLQKILKKSER